jgi:flagellar hook-length control protein FliK
MGNIGAVMLLEDVAVKREQVSQPENELEDFAEILAVLLGQASFSVEQPLVDTLLAKEEVNCSLEREVTKNDLKGLLGMLNPEFSKELLNENEEVELKFKEVESWFKPDQQNVVLGEYWGQPAMESPQLYEKAEKFLQQQSLNLKEIAFLPVTKDEKELAELPERSMLTTLKREQLTPEEKWVSDENLITEHKLANLNERETDENSEETKIVKQLNFSNELKEIIKTPEKEVSLKNEVANEAINEKEAESWAQFFPTKVSENREHGGEELRLSTVHLARDLPEIVLAELKTLEHANGGKDVIIHLEPKELGKLVVKLHTEEGIVSVKFVAHYPVTRNLLESGLDSLRQSFTEQGIPFASLDVELGGQQLNQSQYQHQQQLMWPEEQGYRERSGNWEDSYFEKTVSEVKLDGSRKLGMYDYLV